MDQKPKIQKHSSLNLPMSSCKQWKNKKTEIICAFEYSVYIIELIFLIDLSNMHYGDLRFTSLNQMKLQKFVVVPSGKKHVFSCHVIGDEPISFSWYKNGNLLQTRRIDSLVNTRGPEFVLKDVVLSGNDTCRAKNQYGEIEFQFVLIAQGISFCFRFTGKLKLEILTLFSILAQEQQN